MKRTDQPSQLQSLVAGEAQAVLNFSHVPKQQAAHRCGHFQHTHVLVDAFEQILQRDALGQLLAETRHTHRVVGLVAASFAWLAI
jgi:hypothetical protein